MAMQRLRNQFGIQVCVALSRGDIENINLCTENDFASIVTNNRYLSNKFNAGMSLLKDMDWTHVMILGSDDIPSSSMIREHMRFPDVDFLALNDLWFWGLNPKRAGYGSFMYWYGGSSRIGAGRMISRRVIEALDYELWPNGHVSGLDGKSARKVNGLELDLKRRSYSLRGAGAFMMDVKYEFNISSLSPIMRRGVHEDPSVIFEHLPGDEYEALLQLREKVKSNE